MSVPARKNISCSNDFGVSYLGQLSRASEKRYD